MEVSTICWSINVGSEKYVNHLLIPKDIFARFQKLKINQINENRNYNEIFRILDIIYQSENQIKEILYIYRSLDKLSINNYNLGAAIYYFLARKNGFNIKKPHLVKFLGIELSRFQVLLKILVEIPFFSDIIINANKKEKLRETIEYISESGVPIERKKPPKKSENPISFKTPFFLSLFFVFDKKFIFKYSKIIFLIDISWNRDFSNLKKRSENNSKYIMLNLPNFSSKSFQSKSHLLFYYPITYSFFKYVPLKIDIIDLKNLISMKKIKKSIKIKNKKISFKFASKIEKSQKSGITTSKRIYTQPILKFEKNICSSNPSAIKIKNNFFIKYKI